MSAQLPPATALITHTDDPRHIIYTIWVSPKFFPYVRDLLEELTTQPAQENLARSLLAVLAQPSNIGCPCLILVEKLRSAFHAYGKREMSIANNCAWNAVSVAMVYFILVTDLYFTSPLSDEVKADRLGHIRMLQFAGPKLPAQFLQ